MFACLANLPNLLKLKYCAYQDNLGFMDTAGGLVIHNPEITEPEAVAVSDGNKNRIRNRPCRDCTVQL